MVITASPAVSLPEVEVEVPPTTVPTRAGFGSWESVEPSFSSWESTVPSFADWEEESASLPQDEIPGAQDALQQQQGHHYVVPTRIRGTSPEAEGEDEPTAGSSESVPAAVQPGRIGPDARVEDFSDKLVVSPQARRRGIDQLRLEQVELTWKKAADDYATDIDMNARKIHMLPPGLRGVASRYVVPMAVAIGPYHRHLSHIQQMEKVKQAVAYHFVRDSDRSFEEMYEEVLSIAGHARRLYADEAVAGMSATEFAIMMFRDGCFLLQYMLACTTDRKQPSLVRSCFDSNQACISNDIMLLENQLPWLVIEALRRCRPVLVEEFVAKMGRTLQARGDMERKPFVLEGSYAPPHLLGLLRFYKTGRTIPRVTPSVMSKTIGATELKEIGIKLTPSKTTKFVDMGIKRGLFSSKFFLAPLLLDEVRSCWLVNMVALELCMLRATEVSSYIAVLAMVMDREDDVHELRSKRLVQGELTNKETLEFFKMLVKRISVGPLYIQIMEEVEAYKLNRWMWIKVHRFVYRNFKAIVIVFTIIGVLVGIFKTLLSLNKH